MGRDIWPQYWYDLKNHTKIKSCQAITRKQYQGVADVRKPRWYDKINPLQIKAVRGNKRYLKLTDITL